MRFDVIGLGALNYDRLYKVKRLAAPGEHQPIEGMWESPGGSAANTIACLARLGFKTGFIGAVGEDREGEVMLEDFREYYVDVKRVRVLDGRTGIVMGFVDWGGERTLYPYPRVNDDLTLGEEDLEYASDCRFLHMSSFVGDKQFRSQKKLIKNLSDSVKLSFAPGDVYVNQGYDRLKPVLRKTNVLFLNDMEVKALTGFNYEKGSLRLIEDGIDIVAVTLGKYGCYVRDVKGGYNVKARKTRVLDTTGAGDAFAAGFLSGLVEGKSIIDCSRLGNEIAAGCVGEYGARIKLVRERLE